MEPAVYRLDYDLVRSSTFRLQPTALSAAQPVAFSLDWFAVAAHWK